MTLLAESMMDWLRAKPGVSMLNDASTVDCGEAIRFSFGGARWFVAIDHCTASSWLDDPRSRNTDDKDYEDDDDIDIREILEEANKDEQN